MSEPWTTGVSDRWRSWRAVVDLDEYDSRWDRMAAAGQDVHGEADAVGRLLEPPACVLDAGCGMGRVAVELARRGYAVVGVDADADLLERARRRRPDLRWIHGDLSTLRWEGRFDVIVLAGDVLGFVAGDRRAATVERLGAHLASGGRLVIGGGVDGEVRREDLDRWAREAGLEVSRRWSTWEGAPDDGGGYLVVVYGRAERGETPCR